MDQIHDRGETIEGEIAVRFLDLILPSYPWAVMAWGVPREYDTIAHLVINSETASAKLLERIHDKSQEDTWKRAAGLAATVGSLISKRPAVVDALEQILARSGTSYFSWKIWWALHNAGSKRADASMARILREQPKVYAMAWIGVPTLSGLDGVESTLMDLVVNGIDDDARTIIQHLVRHDCSLLQDARIKTRLWSFLRSGDSYLPEWVVLCADDPDLMAMVVDSVFHENNMYYFYNIYRPCRELRPPRLVKASLPQHLSSNIL